MNKFSQLGLANWITKLCNKINYKKPTKIQKLVIPEILSGRNIIANAETGSGKTATFSFPILQKLSQDPYGVFALVITPNRELAFQITEQLQLFGSSMNLRVCSLIGGLGYIEQKDELDNIPHIVVGTPGRIRDMLQNSDNFAKYIKNLQFLVLDEADRLLFNDGLYYEVEQIIEYLPKQKQVILTSATLKENQFTEEQFKILSPNNLKFSYFTANESMKVVESLQQDYMLIPQQVKDQYFISVLQKFTDIKIIVFVGTCKKCQVLHLVLRKLGIETTCLNSLLSQKQRIANLKKFRSGFFNVLIATDVASRGLDIPTVDLVLNYNIPRSSVDYIHRVGRTARKGKRGQAISLVTQYDIDLVLNIESVIKQKLTEFKINENEILDNMNEILRAKKKVKIEMHENGMADDLDKFKTEKAKFSKKIQKIKKLKKFKMKKQKLSNDNTNSPEIETEQ